MNGGGQGVGEWVRDRLGLDGIRVALAQHRAPRRTFFLYFGGITLFLIAVQVASGVLLALDYSPDAATANDSVRSIVGDVPYGELVRAVHVWTGDLLVVCLFAHLFAVLLRRTYRPPHELTWVSGLAAGAVVLGVAFTGAILPWSETAYTHARVGSELARHAPLFGDWLARVLRGGDEVSPLTLRRAYGFHVAALPALITGLGALHLFFLSRKPAHSPADGAVARGTMPLFPDFFVRQALALTGVLIVVMTLAIFFPRPVGAAADARLASPAGALPPWYLLPVHEIVRGAPRELLGIDGPRFLLGLCGFLAIAVTALPALDPRGSKVTAWLAWAALILLLGLGIHALV
jgi:cytochrome b6